MPDPCFHGGAFWNAIGADFVDTARRHTVVPADVLDAWFPPAPAVLSALKSEAAWLAQTSPPTHCEGLEAAIATSRKLPGRCILAGAGSSALMYLALQRWLAKDARMLLIEPSYGEYSHLGRNVIGCQVDTVESGFELDLESWLVQLQRSPYDLAVLVNPNNPLGTGISAPELIEALQRVPRSTKVLIDEAYIDYTDLGSVEGVAAQSENIFVIKSLSKSFALSGLRVAYMVGNAGEIVQLRKVTPPWPVSLPAQLAAVRALGSLPYYEDRYRETDLLRQSMISQLGEECRGTANWLLVRTGDAERIVADAADERIFLRNAGKSAPSLGNDWVRTAVRSREDNERVIDLLRRQARVHAQV